LLTSAIQWTDAAVLKFQFADFACGIFPICNGDLLNLNNRRFYEKRTIETSEAQSIRRKKAEEGNR